MRGWMTLSTRRRCRGTGVGDSISDATGVHNRAVGGIN